MKSLSDVVSNKVEQRNHLPKKILRSEISIARVTFSCERGIYHLICKYFKVQVETRVRFRGKSSVVK